MQAILLIESTFTILPISKFSNLLILELPWRLSWKRICLQYRRPGFNPWVGAIPWRRAGHVSSGSKLKGCSLFLIILHFDLTHNLPFQSPTAAVTKQHRLDDLNNRTLLSHSSGGQKLTIKGSEGLAPSAVPLIWLLEIYWLESLEFFGQRNITLISVFMFMCHSSLMPIFAHKLPPFSKDSTHFGLVTHPASV